MIVKIILLWSWASQQRFTTNFLKKKFNSEKPKSIWYIGRQKCKDPGDIKIYHPHLTSCVFKPSWEPTSHLLAISKVDGAELGVLLRGRLAMLVLIQKDGGTAHLHAELLDALLVVHRQQEGLEASLGLDGKQDREIFWENSSWRWKKQQACTLVCYQPDQWTRSYKIRVKALFFVQVYLTFYRNALVQIYTIIILQYSNSIVLGIFGSKRFSSFLRMLKKKEGSFFFN